MVEPARFSLKFYDYEGASEIGTLSIESAGLLAGVGTVSVHQVDSGTASLGELIREALDKRVNMISLEGKLSAASITGQEEVQVAGQVNIDPVTPVITLLVRCLSREVPMMMQCNFLDGEFSAISGGVTLFGKAEAGPSQPWCLIGKQKEQAAP